MVNGKELAPGIVVYSMNKYKTMEWYETIHTHSEPFASYGTIVRSGSEGYYSTQNLDHRKCFVFSPNMLTSCHEEDPLLVVARETQAEMDNFVSLFCRKYSAHNAVKNHEIIFLKYNEGDFFLDHNDDSPMYHRTLSSIMYFNDNYDGGEITFKFFNIEYKPKQGDCIVFCAAFPYMHSVKTITKGTRYAAVNWYKYV